MSKTVRYIVLTMILASGGFSAAASVFSGMNLDEVSALLEESAARSSRSDVLSAKESASTACDEGNAPSTVTVSAHDLITKIFGILNLPASRQQCLDASQSILSITPAADNGRLWLDSADGYGLCYHGMAPQVSAAAAVDGNDSIAEYCFFFLFPYDIASHQAGNRAQADFSGTLLQEMADMDLQPGVNVLSDDLFDVSADCEGRAVNVRLLDDRKENGDGRYILMLIVKPGESCADDFMARIP